MTQAEVPVLDLDAALDRVEGDRAFFAELVALLFSEFETGSKRMRQLITASDSQELQSAAHALKSALGNLGAMRCHKLAFALECCGREGKLQEANRLLLELEQEFECFRQAFLEFSKGV